MSTHLSRRTALAAGAALGATLVAAAPALTQAATEQSSAGAADSAGITRLQWSGVALTAEQYPEMKGFTEKALGLELVSSAKDFAAFGAPDGTRFELFGPKAPRSLWRTGATSVAVGFEAMDLEAAGRVLERNGARWVSPVEVTQGAGAGGTPLRLRYFRAPDGRVYRLAQTNADPDRPVAESATGPAEIMKLDFTGIALTDEQFPAMNEFAERALGFTKLELAELAGMPQFTIYLAENGRSRFELYGPEAPKLPWWTDPTSSVRGFKSFDLDKAMANLERNGAEWVTPVLQYDNRFRFFRAPDGRVYSISETVAG
ncbi:VOC family protein [Streptomyces sp. NPDC096132]|uniref:VOC family protein n=1 Tax=Streptomyces sp. NPDC096132 TaxID=3366075 RepID=UPI0038243AB8